MHTLLTEIHDCTLCAQHLPHPPRPVVTAHTNSKMAIVGQAPGSKVHKTGTPWDDKSGERLRSWLQLNETSFYDTQKVALIPMGFCYPGKGKSGDLPPRPECAPQWHASLFGQMQGLKLVLLIGSYAQHYYLGKLQKRTLTETVRHFQDYLPRYFVLPHPSPRNNIWIKKNTWFEEEVLPALRARVKEVLP